MHTHTACLRLLPFRMERYAGAGTVHQTLLSLPCHTITLRLPTTIQLTTLRHSKLQHCRLHLAWYSAGAAPAMAGRSTVHIVIAFAHGAGLLLRSAGRPGTQPALYLLGEVHLRVTAARLVARLASAASGRHPSCQLVACCQTASKSRHTMQLARSRHSVAHSRRGNCLLHTNSRLSKLAASMYGRAHCKWLVCTNNEHTWWYAACTGELDCSSAASLLDAALSSAQ